MVFIPICLFFCPLYIVILGIWLCLSNIQQPSGETDVPSWAGPPGQNLHRALPLGDEVQRACAYTGQTDAGPLGEAGQDQGSPAATTAAFVSRSLPNDITKTMPSQNIFVSYNMDHFEDDEDEIPYGKRSKV